MKKSIILSSLLFVLLVSPGITQAQTITRQDVLTLRPQLLGLLSSLSNTTSYIQARMATENALFRQYSTTLSTISSRIQATTSTTTGTTTATTTLSSTELQGIQNTLTEMQRMVGLAVSWRADVEARLSNITTILGSITNIIASAR